MSPEPPPRREQDRGDEVESTLWGVVARLRARGWHISLWEIQRAQDMIAYLYVRLQRPPTDEELQQHLRPILCARESELATFADAFRESRAAPIRDPADPSPRRGRRLPVLVVVGMAVVAIGAAVIALLALPSSDGSGTPGGTAAAGGTTALPTINFASPWVWATAIAAAVTGMAGSWLVAHKWLRRGPAPLDPSHDLELQWATGHPLDSLSCARIARVLRAREREPSNALDVRRTVDASVRAGLRLNPRFMQHKRAPEYLAVIEQRSAQDVLATHYAKVVDQVGAEGVEMRRVGLQTRSQLVVDPLRGRRRLETLQPSSERERLLLFAPDRTLRDPLSGAARPWLARFGRWHETIQIGPDVDPTRSLPVVDRVLTDVRHLDPAWGRLQRSELPVPTRGLPAMFETGDELWIEVVPPSTEEVARALDLLGTSLGPSGWYWLSACALYPEINYDLTVALGRLLRDDEGQPVAAQLDVAELARLPWFRHAHMPDWLRTTLISSLSRDQLVRARAALDEILVSGVLGAAAGSGTFSVVGVRRGRRRRAAGGSSPGHPGMVQDRVYLDGVALRRRRLAAAAPRQLVDEVRRQRNRRTTLPAESRTSRRDDSGPRRQDMIVEPPGSHEPTEYAKTPRKAAASGWIGNAFVYYDFFIYAQAAALVFPNIFFPSVDPQVAIVAAFATFGVGYLARPVGAFVLGHWGDTHGRKNLVVLCMLLMGVSTFLVALLPTYDQVGILAPILLVILRLIQGFAVGGEIAGSGAMIVEHAPFGRRGYYGSFTLQGVQAGQVIAAAVFLPLSAALPAEAFQSFGWRLPFLLSLVAVVAAFIIRRRVDETPAFQEQAAHGEVPTAPIVRAVRANGVDILRVICMALMNAIPTAVTVFGASFATNAGYGVGLSTTNYLWISVVGNVVAVFLIPFVGNLSDMVGRRPVIILGCLGSGILAFPYLYFVAQANLVMAFLSAVLMWGVVYQGYNAVFPSFYHELFPTATRVTGFAVSQNIGTMITAFMPAIYVTLVGSTPSACVVDRTFAPDVQLPTGETCRAAADAIGGNVVWTVGTITFGLAIVAAVAAFSARETFRVHLNDLGIKGTVPVPREEYDRLRSWSR